MLYTVIIYILCTLAIKTHLGGTIMSKRKYTLLKIGFSLTFLTVVLHIINKLVSASAVFKNLLNTKSGDYYKWRFGDVFYKKQGSGSPLLLIHHLSPSSSSEEWKSVIKELSQKHTVYAIDLLGCGRSAKPNLTYTNFLYVQLATDFVENVIGQKTDVIASGLSGSFVVMACANNEETFNKVMLINPEDINTLNQIPSKASKFVKNLLDLPLIGTLVYNILTSKSNIELLFTEKYLYNPFSVAQSTIDTYYEAAHTSAGKGKYLLSSIIGKYIYFNISHGLKSINNSLFIVTGADSTNADETIALYTLLNPAFESETIPKTKLLPQQEAPEQLLELIRTFF